VEELDHEAAFAAQYHQGNPDTPTSMSMIPPNEASYNGVLDLLFAY
jgi:hypothetical protein